MNVDYSAAAASVASDGLSAGRCDSAYQKSKPNHSDLASYVTAIAQPRMINAWSPMKKQSNNRLSGMGGSFRNMRVDDSPDFRITRGTGVQSDANKRLATMNSKRSSAERIPRADVSPSKNGQTALRSDSCAHFEERSTAMSNASPKNLVEISKMRKLNDARRDWETRHCSNSPFRFDNYGSSSSIGMDTSSCEGSPMVMNRGYGLRSIISKGDQYLATQQKPLNLSNNKQSSFAKKSNISSTGKKSSLVNATNSPMSGQHGSTLMS